MSNYISIKGVASYHPEEEQRLDLSKRNIFVFGLNGTGKSTISNYLYKETQEHSDCRFVIDGESTPLVYNHQFIEDNFFNSDEQKGVFTLSKNNGEIEKKIAGKEKIRGSLGEKYKTVLDEIRNLESDKEKVHEKALSEVYDKKKSIEGTSLEELLKGFIRPKKKFYGELISHTLIDGELIAELISEMDALVEFDGVSIKSIEMPVFESLTDEEITILREPVVGSGNSQLSNFIEEIENLSWVKLGRELYLDDGQEKCPFCQNDTISMEFREELNKLFDKTYDERLKKIIQIEAGFKNQIDDYIERLKNTFFDCALYDPEKHKILPLISLVESALEGILKQITEKTKDLNKVVEIKFCSEKTSDLSSIADEINREVDGVNKKTEKIKESKDDIKARMWGVLRSQANDLLRIEEEDIKGLEVKINEKKLYLERIKRVGKKVRDKIDDLRKNTSNIDQTIEKINSNLAALGLVGFEIIKHQKGENESFFKISRGDGEENVFKSLSEGEKTLIAFLYFIELCNGSNAKDSSVDQSDKFIVIDDPISSLSQNYVYDVASLIHNDLIKGAKFKRVLILTHSLFFYHELIKLSPSNKVKFDSNYSLYRISKNKYSKIIPIQGGDIKNDYQSLWQIMKDVLASNTDPVVLPNVMRNILEYYFGFVHKKEKLGSVLNDLAEQEPNQGYKSFYRYINRESHSDPTNIGYMMDVQPDIYLERFKKVFEQMDDLNHYARMME